MQPSSPKVLSSLSAKERAAKENKNKQSRPPVRASGRLQERGARYA